MKKILFAFTTIAVALHVQAQKAASPAGEYFLTGEREMAAGFLLDSNGRFEFFFIYGALDRQAVGRWEKREDRLILQSESKGKKDFELTASKKVPGTQVRLLLTGLPKEMMQYMQATGIFKGKQATATARESGSMLLALPALDSVVLQFQWCPDKATRFAMTSHAANEYTFRVLPSITDVVFDNFPLQILDDGLAGVLPFSGDHVCHFRKRKSGEEVP